MYTRVLCKDRQCKCRSLVRTPEFITFLMLKKLFSTDFKSKCFLSKYREEYTESNHTKYIVISWTMNPKDYRKNRLDMNVSSATHEEWVAVNKNVSLNTLVGLNLQWCNCRPHRICKYRGVWARRARRTIRLSFLKLF